MTDPTGGPEKVIESFRVFDSTKSGMVDLKTVRDVMVRKMCTYHAFGWIES